jgi:hypothetical protein
VLRPSFTINSKSRNVCLAKSCKAALRYCFSLSRNNHRYLLHTT